MTRNGFDLFELWNAGKMLKQDTNWKNLQKHAETFKNDLFNSTKDLFIVNTQTGVIYYQ